MIAILDIKTADGQAIIDAVNRAGLTGTNRDIELVCIIDEVLEAALEREISEQLSDANREISRLREEVFDLEFQNDELKDTVKELAATVAESRGDA